MSSTSISVPSPAGRSRNWLDLPPELTSSILARVGALDVLHNASKVCKTWRRIICEPDMWRVVNLRMSGSLHDIIFDWYKIARLAVDLSCGQMIELSIEGFGDDKLLSYISDRSCHLRRFRLVNQNRIMDKGLIKMLRKLPMLEELHLYLLSIRNKTIEIAGRCCPNLKSFKLNNQRFHGPCIGCDENALVIAENMPGLRHLQLFGQGITSNGLRRILEKCLQLESLDLRCCFNIDNLGPDLVRRLSQQMKVLRLPYDSIEDYEFKDEIRFRDPFGPHYVIDRFYEAYNDYGYAYNGNAYDGYAYNGYAYNGYAYDGYAYNGYNYN